VLATVIYPEKQLSSKLVLSYLMKKSGIYDEVIICLAQSFFLFSSNRCKVLLLAVKLVILGFHRCKVLLLVVKLMMAEENDCNR